MYLINVMCNLIKNMVFIEKKKFVTIRGTQQECATERSYCLAMQSEGMLADLVRNLTVSDR